MKKSVSAEDLMRALPNESLDIVERLVTAAAARDTRLYLVGGPVRDFLLGREIRDVDLIFQPPAAPAGAVGEANADWVRKAISAEHRVVEHSRFGTLRIEGEDCTVDLARVRRESYERPGALPSVESGDLDDDLARRDFSVNALAIQLSPLALHSPGRGGERWSVLDPQGGLADLADRKLRVLHPQSFHDDPTRALRAARLAPRLGFSLGRAARTALRSALRDGAFGAVSGDRLKREIQKCFSDAEHGLNPAAALRLLGDWHVLTALEPGLALPREAVSPLRRLGRAIAEPPWRPARARHWVSGLALWLAPQPSGLARRTLRRFSLRGDAANRIAAFPRLCAQRLDALAKVRGRGAVDALLRGIDEDELWALHASAPPAVRRRILRWAAEDRSRRLPLSGSDVEEMGLSGPAVGRVLARVRSAFLDGEVANREEALALAHEVARQKNRAKGRHRPSK